MDGNSGEQKWRVHSQSQVVRGYISFTYGALSCVSVLQYAASSGAVTKSKIVIVSLL